jgi:hypothetical protein
LQLYSTAHKPIPTLIVELHKRCSEEPGFLGLQ